MNIENQVYTLTGDLLEDCMALIPHNIELLNGKKSLFLVKSIEKVKSYTIESHMKYEQIIVQFDNDPTDFYEIEIVLSEDLSGYQDQMLQFAFISHCLRTIPEFQAENPNCSQFVKAYAEKQQTNPQPTFAQGYKRRDLELVPKTISEAALRGLVVDGDLIVQSKYPPSTVAELCESYKLASK